MGAPAPKKLALASPPKKTPPSEADLEQRYKEEMKTFKENKHCMKCKHEKIFTRKNILLCKTHRTPNCKREQFLSARKPASGMLVPELTTKGVSTEPVIQQQEEEGTKVGVSIPRSLNL